MTTFKSQEQADFGYQLLGFKMNHRTAEDVAGGVIEPLDNWVPKRQKLDRRLHGQLIEKGLLVKGMVKDCFMVAANQSTRNSATILGV